VTVAAPPRCAATRAGTLIRQRHPGTVRGVTSSDPTEPPPSPPDPGRPVQEPSDADQPVRPPRTVVAAALVLCGFGALVTAILGSFALAAGATVGALTVALLLVLVVAAALGLVRGIRAGLVVTCVLVLTAVVAAVVGSVRAGNPLGSVCTLAFAGTVLGLLFGPEVSRRWFRPT